MKKTTLKIAGAILCVALALCFMGCPEPEVKPDYGTCAVGDFILKDGSILSKDSTPAANTVAAVIVRAKNGNTPALGVGIVHNQTGLAWCSGGAVGFDTTIEALIGDATSGYMDGSDSWEKLKTACNDAEEHPEYYPAFNYCLTYATTNSLAGELATGWYLPTVAELKTIYDNKGVIDASLGKAGGNTFGSSSYWSCCQHSDNKLWAWTLDFSDGNIPSYSLKDEVDFFYVCAVRAFN